MTQREKLLLAAVAMLGVVFAGLWAIGRVSDAFDTRNDQIAQLQEEIRKKNFTKALGSRAATRLARYEQQALPESDNRELARALYQTWLLQAVEDANMSDIKVDPVGGRAVGDVYFVHPFSVAVRGDLNDLVQFLYTFYRADFLHRIERIAVSPIKDSNQLDITMTVEAAALPGSPNVDALREEPSSRLALDSLEDYTKPILRRNIFGPPNASPRLDTVSRREAIVNKPFSMQLRARDPNRQDTLRYWLNADEKLGAKINESTGELSFTPDALGEYSLTVGVQDNGLPEGSDEVTFTIAVVDPPPPPEPKKDPPKPTFDEAQHAFITGIIDVNGKPEVWISVRTNGTLLKLHEGDEIRIGQFEGKIRRIHRKVIQVDSGERQLFVKHGDHLGQAEELPVEDL